MLEHRGKECCLRDKFLLALVDGPHRCASVQKLVTSTQPGSKWAPQTFSMILVSAPVSEIIMGRVPLKMSISANMLFGLVL